MNIHGIAHIKGGGETAVGRGVHSAALGVPQIAPVVVRGIIFFRRVSGERNLNERERALLPVITPVADHGLHLVCIKFCPFRRMRIGAALIPDRTADPVGKQRADHAVEQDPEAVGIVGSHIHIAGEPDHIPVHFRIQHASAVDGDFFIRSGKRHIVVLSGPGERAVIDERIRPDCDHIRSRLHQRTRHRIATVSVPVIQLKIFAGAADLFPVEKGGIVLIHAPQMHFQILPCPMSRQFHFFPDPDHAVAGKFFQHPAAGNGKLFPAAVVVIQLPPALRRAGIFRTRGTVFFDQDFLSQIVCIVHGHFPVHHPPAVGIGEIFHVLLHQNCLLWIVPQTFHTGPGFHNGAAPGTGKNTDRNFQIVTQFLGKPQRHRTHGTDIFRRDRGPFRLLRTNPLSGLDLRVFNACRKCLRRNFPFRHG